MRRRHGSPLSWCASTWPTANRRRAAFYLVRPLPEQLQLSVADRHARFRGLVEHEVLELGAKIGRVANTCARQIGFGILRDVAWVSPVRLAADGVPDVADQNQCLRLAERV